MTGNIEKFLEVAISEVEKGGDMESLIKNEYLYKNIPKTLDFRDLYRIAKYITTVYKNRIINTVLEDDLK